MKIATGSYKSPVFLKATGVRPVKCSREPKWIQDIGLVTNEHPSRNGLFYCTEPKTGTAVYHFLSESRAEAKKYAIKRLKMLGEKNYKIIVTEAKKALGL